MSLMPRIATGKHCQIYCGPERCDCQLSQPPEGWPATVAWEPELVTGGDVHPAVAGYLGLCDMVRTMASQGVSRRTIKMCVDLPDNVIDELFERRIGEA